MSKKLVATAAFAMVLGLAGRAEAITIDSTSYTLAGCLGASSCAIGGASLTAVGPSAVFDEAIFTKGVGVNPGLGIASDINVGGARALEIQGDGGAVEGGPGLEGVLISFLTPQNVAEIDLAQFYNPDSFGVGGDPQEIAIICANVTICGTIQNLNDGGGPGGFALGGALSGAAVTQTDTDGGNWQLLNPFGNLAITSLLFQAADITNPQGGDNSDYSIALVQTSDVPEPTTLGLLGIGLLGLGMAGRRRRNSSLEMMRPT